MTTRRGAEVDHMLDMMMDEEMEFAHHDDPDFDD